jgi:hypothetical protein
MKRNIYNFLFVFAVAVILCSCKDDDPVVSKITFDNATATLLVGEDSTVTATITADGGANKTITWSTDNGSIASVDANGKVEAVSTGVAHITATSKNGVKATCTVTVVNGYRYDGEVTEIETAVYGDYSNSEGGGLQFWFFPTEEASSTFDGANEYTWLDIPKEMVGEPFELTEESNFDWGWWVTYVVKDQELEYEGFGSPEQMEDVASGTMSAKVLGDDTFMVTTDVLFTDGKTFQLGYSGSMVEDASYYGGRIGGRKPLTGKGNSK